MHKLPVCLLILSALFSHSLSAEFFVRFNHAGYSLERDKEIVVISTNDLTGESWQLSNEQGKIVKQGKLAKSLIGKTDHTSHAYNHLLDLSSVKSAGKYQLLLNQHSETIVIGQPPLKELASNMLQFLRNARSGSNDNKLTPNSHQGDKAVPIYRPIGAIEQGQWQIDRSAEKLNMLGGWYDAGDYIKFTLTIAYTSYYLLRAYQENPEFFMNNANKDAVSILDEAKFGLDYLVKTYPSKDEFIIQLSTGKDHHEPSRLPIQDRRDGKREALSAISPAHMGLTSAALALGSHLAAQSGDDARAKQYKNAAIAIYQRAKEEDALKQPAFERDQVNDFYRDDSHLDNMGLAAIELYLLTQNKHYLKQANQYSELAGAGSWSAWCCVTSSLNYRLAPYSEKAKQRLAEELKGYRQYDSAKGNIWGVPMIPTWAPLQGAHIVASYAGLYAETEQPQLMSLLWDNLDYLFGRNNWGVSFVATSLLDNAAQHFYTQVYKLLDLYPTGAVAEGPGSKDSYLSLKRYFKASELDNHYQQFNTSTQVFFDNSSNFQTMESTITIQAATIYMLAVADKLSVTAN